VLLFNIAVSTWFC